MWQLRTRLRKMEFTQTNIGEYIFQVIKRFINPSSRQPCTLMYKSDTIEISSPLDLSLTRPSPSPMRTVPTKLPIQITYILDLQQRQQRNQTLHWKSTTGLKSHLSLRTKLAMLNFISPKDTVTLDCQYSKSTIRTEIHSFLKNQSGKQYWSPYPKGTFTHNRGWDGHQHWITVILLKQKPR